MRSALSAIERYTGEYPAVHKWQFAVRERGAKVFTLLDNSRATRVSFSGFQFRSQSRELGTGILPDAETVTSQLPATAKLALGLR